MTDRITSPFGAFSTAREVLAGHDLTGRTAIVTGGATGIGIETARALAEAGAEVVIAVRKPDLGQAAADEVNKTAKGAKARVELVDLADLKTVRAFAERWGDEPLHLLGVSLAPALEKGAEEGKHARLVSLSSIGHLRSPVDFEDPNFRHRPYEKWSAYGQSKTANALFAVGFHQRFKDRGVVANSVMPGGIMTPLQRHLPREEQIAMGWIDEHGTVANGFKTPEQGASTSIWAAVGPELEDVGGLYLENCAEALPVDKSRPRLGVAPYALDPEAADRLWDLSVKTTGA
jgi:NAD(P)-dependent dehydrogenase (short-subunit alcohol dehydrogenase family)